MVGTPTPTLGPLPHHDEPGSHSGHADGLDGVRVVEASVDVSVDAEADGVHGSDAGQRGRDPAVETSNLRKGRSGFKNST